MLAGIVIHSVLGTINAWISIADSSIWAGCNLLMRCGDARSESPYLIHLEQLAMELEVAVLQIPATPRQEAVTVSKFRFSLWSGLLAHTIAVLIILSDDESAGAESEIDYSDLDMNIRAKSNSDPPQLRNSELASPDVHTGC